MYRIIIILILLSCSNDSSIKPKKDEGFLLHEGNLKIWKQKLYARTEDGKIQALQPISDRWLFYYDTKFEVEWRNKKGNWEVNNYGFWIVEDGLFRLIIDNIYFDFRLLSLTENQFTLESGNYGIIFNETWETF